MQWTSDLRHAWRALIRTPAFLLTSVVTLALAIGAVVGMFNVVNAVLIRPLPFPDADRLVVLSGTAPGSDLPEIFGLAPEFYVHYKERSRLLDGIFMFEDGTSTFRTDDRVERISMAFPTNDAYATLGVRPHHGRLPVAEDGPGVVLISDQLWSTWFGRDPGVIGKRYLVAGQVREVIGIMPPDFMFPDDGTLLWVSTGEVRTAGIQPGQLGAPLIARLKPGVTREQLADELTALSKELPARFGGSPAYVRVIGQHRAVVEPVLDRLVGPTATTSLWVLFAAVSIALLIACANVANLFLVRAEGRRRELAVRRAIGASRARLVRLQLSEALLVALPAGVPAVLLSGLTLPLFVRAAPQGIPRLGSIGLDAATLVAAGGLVLLVALVCGAVPALLASSPDLNRLRESSRGSTRRRGLGRDLLVVAQTALALVLLIGAALLVQSFQRLRSVDPGYDTEDIYTFQFAPEQERLTDGPSWGRLHLDFMDRLRALPGVTGVGIVNNIPLDEGTSGGRFVTDGMAAQSGVLLDQNFAAGDYFRVMGIDLLRGRTFTSEEAVTPNSSVVISRSAAERLWPNQDPVNKRIRRPTGAEQWFTVVGVVEDVKQDDWRAAGEAIVYFPLTGPTPTSWALGSPAYVVKSSRAESLGREVRDLVRQIAPEAPVYREYTMAFLAERSMVQLSFTMLTLGVVSGLAIVLGAVGLYGVLSYSVAGRTREIGVRMALGATGAAVSRMVVSQGARVVIAGVVVGLLVALASTRLLEALLFGVDAVSTPVFVVMSAVMIAIGMLASYVPARRASRVNPIESLRIE